MSRFRFSALPDAKLKDVWRSTFLGALCGGCSALTLLWLPAMIGATGPEAERLFGFGQAVLLVATVALLSVSFIASHELDKREHQVEGE